ncbi:unnamed protein product [Orchesella dallaii]|uniref:Uncharacterized protein n=1 Tax=Orchesella dallaii TaxID=48710 RepID=A0ABP1RLR8_9HEXA
MASSWINPASARNDERRGSRSHLHDFFCESSNKHNTAMYRLIKKIDELQLSVSSVENITLSDATIQGAQEALLDLKRDGVITMLKDQAGCVNSTPPQKKKIPALRRKFQQLQQERVKTSSPKCATNEAVTRKSTRPEKLSEVYKPKSQAETSNQTLFQTPTSKETDKMIKPATSKQQSSADTDISLHASSSSDSSETSDSGANENNISASSTTEELQKELDKVKLGQKKRDAVQPKHPEPVERG